MTIKKSDDQGPEHPALFATIHHRSGERPDGYTPEEIAELNKVANQHRRGTLIKGRKLLYLAAGVISLLAILFAAAVWLSPAWMPGQIVKAAEIGDRSTLERLVDFQTVKDGLKIDLKDMMKASYRKEITATGDPLTLMFSGIGDSIVEATADSLVDQLVTPLALEKAARGEDVQFSLLGQVNSALPDFRPVRNGLPSFTAKGRYLTFSRYQFTLRSIDTDQKFDVQMQRSGPFSWRIDRVRMDPSFVSDLQRHEPDSINEGTEVATATPPLNTPGIATGDEPPPFQPGQLYSSYRKELQSQGFVPVPQAHPEPNYFCGTEFADEGEPDLCVAYPEVEDCGGTGMRPYLFVFHRSRDGRRLNVSTEGELFSRIFVRSTEWRD